MRKRTKVKEGVGNSSSVVGADSQPLSRPARPPSSPEGRPSKVGRPKGIVTRPRLRRRRLPTPPDSPTPPQGRNRCHTALPLGRPVPLAVVPGVYADGVVPTPVQAPTQAPTVGVDQGVTEGKGEGCLWVPGHLGSTLLRPVWYLPPYTGPSPHPPRTGPTSPTLNPTPSVCGEVRRYADCLWEGPRGRVLLWVVGSASNHEVSSPFTSRLSVRVSSCAHLSVYARV